MGPIPVHAPGQMPLLTSTCTYFQVHVTVIFMSDPGMWKKLRKQLKDQGCTIKQQSNTHYRIYRDGELITIIQSGRASQRAWHNKRAELRRKGLEVK